MRQMLILRVITVPDGPFHHFRASKSVDFTLFRRNCERARRVESNCNVKKAYKVQRARFLNMKAAMLLQLFVTPVAFVALLPCSLVRLFLLLEFPS